MRSHNSGNIQSENLHIWAVEQKNHFSKTKCIFTKKYTTIIRTYWDTKYESRRENEYGWLAAVCLMHVDISSQLASGFVSMYPSHSQEGKIFILLLGNMLSWCLQPFSITFFSGQDDLKEQLFKKHQSSYSCYGYRKKFN